MPIDICSLDSADVAEVYLTAAPTPGGADQQAPEVFGAIASALRDIGATMINERVFFAPNCAKVVAAARADAYGDLDDGVRPSLLHIAGNANGPLGGVQIHAVVGDVSIDGLEVDGNRCGRLVRCGDRGLLTVSGLTAPQAGSAVDQARAMLAAAENFAHQAGVDMFAVPRTWIWLADLLAWYDDFNAVRNDFFRQRGLLSDSAGHQLPASTGISIGPADGGHCAMDMVAVAGDNKIVERYLAGGDQNSAFDYGSAFSRAVRAETLAGSTVYVSGTAAINAEGASEHIDDAAAQIADTIGHARAVLADADCGDDDVVQSMIYCKTPEVEQEFHRQFGDLCWPQIIAVCDICRHDLLFEVEVTACPGAKKL
ncbi:hypothetical protein LCGC14_0369000 [marine sediment metagenome]|uniref:Uncharacterized protein n=1 Tax=marine sediment metagenome TaxID=412755 RepID=A0A0F9WEC1_9ZZZZ|nr:hypothetical protein [Phycisphaerae bacterium]HDZ43077.1 hypothetical protein [Phycisphaerae bacterium]